MAPRTGTRDFETALRVDRNYVDVLHDRARIKIEAGDVVGGQADLDRVRQLEASAPR